MSSHLGRKAQLNARLADLNSRILGIEVELISHHAADWQELATERESDEVLQSVGSLAQHEIMMINAALRRIETEEYGTCAKCGEEIDDDRLDVLPYTPLCHHCAI